MPIEWKNSLVNNGRGAPPETQKRNLPPRASRTLDSTSLFASPYENPPGVLPAISCG